MSFQILSNFPVCKLHSKKFYGMFKIILDFLELEIISQYPIRKIILLRNRDKIYKIFSTYTADILH